MRDGFYRSKDPTNSIKVLKEMLQKTNQTTETTQNTHAYGTLAQLHCTQCLKKPAKLFLL